MTLQVLARRKTQKFIALGLVSSAPFGYTVGIAFAILARQAGLTVAETCLMSLTVFAGASQIMAAGMWGEGAAIAAIIFATFILNLRHIIMSTCVMNKMRSAPSAVRAVGAFGVTDESFAIFSPLERERATPAFYFGLITVTYSSWNVGTLIGALGAGLLPEVLALSFGVALYAMFIAIITPDVSGNGRLLLLVLLCALANWALGLVLDSSLAMVISTLLGAFVGVFFVELDGTAGGAGENSEVRE